MTDATSRALTVFYDGRCSLCTRTRAALTRMDRGRGRVRFMDFRANPEAPARHAITPEAMEGAMHAVHPDGRVTKGPEAVRDALRAVGLGPVAWALRLPVVGALFARFYDVLARNRLRWFGVKGATDCEHGACRVTPGAGDRTPPR